MQFIEWLRTDPQGNGQAWHGRLTMHACQGAHAAMDVEPGAAQWQAGECIAVGGKGTTAQADGVQVYRDMFSLILRKRGNEEAPCTTELLASAASLSRAGIAAFSGTRSGPLTVGAKESVALMRELYWLGEARRHEALAAFEEQGSGSDTEERSERLEVKRAMGDILREEPNRIRNKLAARLTRLLSGQALDKASALIAAYPEMRFGELSPSESSDQ